MRIVGLAVVLAGCANAELGDVYGRITVTTASTQALFQTAPVPGFSDGACTSFEFPETRRDISAGFIDLAWPDGDVRMEPLARGLYGQEAGIDLAPGEQVTASAPGVDLPGFALATTGVEPLPPLGDPLARVQLPAFDGTPLSITWTPSSPPGDATVAVDGVAVAFHGSGENHAFHCEGPDTGSLVMSAAFTDYLRQVSPTAGGFLSRYHADVHTEPGFTVELRVTTGLWVEFGS